MKHPFQKDFVRNTGVYVKPQEEGTQFTSGNEGENHILGKKGKRFARHLRSNAKGQPIDRTSNNLVDFKVIQRYFKKFGLKPFVSNVKLWNRQEFYQYTMAKDALEATSLVSELYTKSIGIVTRPL